MKVYLVSYRNAEGKRVFLPTSFDKWGAIEQIRKQPTAKMHVLRTTIKAIRRSAKEKVV